MPGKLLDNVMPMRPDDQTVQVAGKDSNEHLLDIIDRDHAPVLKSNHFNLEKGTIPASKHLQKSMFPLRPLRILDVNDEVPWTDQPLNS